MSTENHIVQLGLFGKRIRQIRKNQKLTLLELEVRTGINNGDLSRIENGKTNVEFFTVAKIAEALNVPMIELFNYVIPAIEPKKKKTPWQNRRKNNNVLKPFTIAVI